ncbi:MAG TPA: glycosyltransferase family 1 protein [Glaciihabitans sp.]|nr:glycosyltransferase family 1 protein [Glaciihabitans sp.]
MLAPSAAGVDRYTEELTRALIYTAPDGCNVSGLVASSPHEEYRQLLQSLPGLVELGKSAFARRELYAAWQHGITRLAGGGMVHATSLLAPLTKHDRLNNAGDQTVVTIHNALPWTHAADLPSRTVSWHRTMAKRAFRFADAVVVPSHSVAAEIDEALHFGDRIRVISEAVSSTLLLPVDPDARADELKLPSRYILAVGTLADHTGISSLLRALTKEADAALPLLLVGPMTDAEKSAVAALSAELGLAPGRVRTLGELTDSDLAVVIDRASVFVYPRKAEGFGLPVLNAFFFGTPVVHSDIPALVEISAGAGVSVPLAGTEEFADRLAAAITSIVSDNNLARHLRYAGLDRAGAFSWRDSAQRVWQLHADL